MLVAIMFMAGFAVVGWITRGSPVPVLVARAPAPVVSAPTFTETREELARGGPPPKPQPSDDDAQRNALRQAALQAATGFSLSPCDAGMKAAAIRDITAYAREIADKSGCGRFMCGGEARMEMATRLFSTALDERVREQVAAAFEVGLRLDDFPPSLRLALLMVSKGNGDGQSPCGKPREARR
ncbi:MAG: hypothetical protein HXX10_04100 [Rhodoplanes sp.]|uniref:hypothetical protein n=1 Tax=Rhodoplanes sp. TaxID=1968906 RepID=UPI00180746AF|nr:hypothetical protein [Rhodoplanes sp.]NVO13197.1 hypothetical protein [Rhodoplanes sp.]